MIRFSLMAICGFCCQPKNMHTILNLLFSLPLTLYIYYIHISHINTYIFNCLSVTMQHWHLQWNAHLSIVIPSFPVRISHWLTLSSFVIINQARKPQNCLPPSPFPSYRPQTTSVIYEICIACKWSMAKCLFIVVGQRILQLLLRWRIPRLKGFPTCLELAFRRLCCLAKLKAFPNWKPWVDALRNDK